MTAYRPAPHVPELPLPRRNLGLFTMLAAVVAALGFLVPLPMLATSWGWRTFREGGLGMVVVLVTASAVAIVVGLAGAFAVRGRGPGAAAVAAVGFLPAVVGTLLAASAMRTVIRAVAGASPESTTRLLAYGLAESDAMPAYGCFVSAFACGSAAVALLGAAAAVDRTRHGAPAGSSYAGPLLLGVIGSVVALGTRVVLRTGATSLVLVAPSLVIVTALACLAARNAVFVRHWREPSEGDAWVSGTLAAGVLAAAGVAFVSAAAALVYERTGLDAAAGIGDPAMRAVVLGAVADEHASHGVIARVDAALAFAIVLPAGLAGMGRGRNGKLRVPRGATLPVAALTALVAVGAMTAARAGAFDAMAAVHGDGVRDGDIEIPRVRRSAALVEPTVDARVVRVDRHGERQRAPSRGGSLETVAVEADRRALWGDVARHVRAELDAIEDARPRMLARMTLEIRVGPVERVDRARLAPYEALLGDETVAVRAALVGPRDRLEGAAMRPRANEIMDGIAAAIAARADGYGAAPTVVLLPPDGDW